MTRVTRVPVKPPKAAQDIAREALEVRASLPKSKRGGLTTREAGRQGVGSGIARARDIVAGKNLDAGQVAMRKAAETALQRAQKGTSE